MNRPTLYVQECPICGRRLLVRIELLGRTVACQHCQAQFLARDPSRYGRAVDPTDRPGIMERAQALLEQFERRSTPAEDLRADLRAELRADLQADSETAERPDRSERPSVPAGSHRAAYPLRSPWAN